MTQPYRCPVCNGNGLVPNGFYSQTSGGWASASTAPETCRSCDGSGFVWLHSTNMESQAAPQETTGYPEIPWEQTPAGRAGIRNPQETTTDAPACEHRWERNEWLSGDSGSTPLYYCVAAEWCIAIKLGSMVYLPAGSA
jgi:hypothetical protein